ncbi:MAG: hypothetical protein K8H90_07565, partial [Thermoanaerobaculia bacterium]|nr:hypothetical protein [Thermoanaerobaculia bacterium]
YYDSGLYLIAGAGEVWDPNDLVLLKNDPLYNEAWPRAVVPYLAVHGVAEPDELPWLPNDGGVHPELPPGTPFGLVGSSSFYNRESFPGFVPSWSDDFDGLDAFNTSENNQSSNWSWQGSDAGLYSNSEIWAVRIVGLEPNTHRSYGPNEGRHFVNHASERMRILGEIPLRKVDGAGQPILDPTGAPDTSFLAKIPADVPFTFQTLDRRGMALNISQTWHQVRPGELRANCGGCHAHSQEPVDFAATAAAAASYDVYDLSQQTPMLIAGSAGGDPDLVVLPSRSEDVEFYRDIRPLLQRSCVTCHSSANPNPPGSLVLDDLGLDDGLPGDYRRLARDSDADWGYPPVISNGTWRQTNASRYVRKFQSRRSLLTWKVFGERLDGWDNDDHPTESTPGNSATLPAGADPNQADLDFTGDIMPPPGSGVPPLSDDEKMTIARWIDLGCPIDSGSQTGNEGFGWFLDDLRPTLTVTLPRSGYNSTPVDRLQFGMVDNYSGLDLDTLSIQADFTVAGRPPGSDLSDLAAALGGGVWTLPLGAPLPPLPTRHLRVEVYDLQGNVTRVDRAFSTQSPATLFADGFESGDTASW